MGDKMVMDKLDMVKVDMVKPDMDKPDTAIKTITTMTTGVKIMGTKNNLMEGTKRNLDMDKPNMDKPNMDKPVMDKPVMDKPITEKPNMEKRATIRPGPWHKTPFY